MVFSSQTFLFFFLPLAGLCVLIRSKPVQNAMLLIASLIFYAWGEPKMVVLMVLVTLVAYGSGFAIVHFEARPRAKKAALIAAIVVILGNLVVFKYLNFLCRTFSFLGLTDPGIALPIGISFYTFQILSYVIDLYRGKIALQRNFFYLLMYVSFFPQLIAGPIVRYETVEQEIRERQVTMDDLAQGFRRFVVGLAKKLLLANQVAQVATIVYSGNPANYGSLMYWLAAIAYTLQIYFDFSGYSDMAGCSASTSSKTSTTRISPCRSRSSGGGGTSRCPPGFATMCTYRSAATAFPGGSGCATFSSSGA